MATFSLNKMFVTGLAPDKALGHIAFNEKGTLGVIMGFERIEAVVVFYGNALSGGDLWLAVAPLVCAVKPDPKIAAQIFERLYRNTVPPEMGKNALKKSAPNLETMIKAWFNHVGASPNIDIANGFVISKEAEQEHEQRRQGDEDEDEDDGPDGTYKG